MHLEFVTTDRYVDLAKGEADVALRSGDVPDSNLIGRKVGESLWAVYAGLEYVRAHGEAKTLELAAACAWVALDPFIPKRRYSEWLRRVAPGAKIAVTSNSILGLVQATNANMGLAALPTALGDSEPGLVRLFGPVPELTRIWRILTTKQLRRTPRVKSFFEFMAQESATLRPILGG